MLKNGILLSVFIFFGSISVLAVDLSDPRLSQSQVYAEAMLKRYPPNQFVILGLGRTTGLISERLRQLSKEEDYVFEAPVENLFSILDLDPKGREKFFKKILPSPEVVRGRHLVLHRVIWYGLTMNYTLNEFIDYLKDKKYSMPLHAYLIAAHPIEELALYEDEHLKPFLSNIEIQSVVDPEFQKRYLKEIDIERIERGLSDLGKWVAAEPLEIIENGFQFKPNVKYQKLLNLIEQHKKRVQDKTKKCVQNFSLK